MKACRDLRADLEWLAAGELAGERRRRAEEHVRTCPACRRELAEWRSLLAAVALPAGEAEADSVDWQAVTDKVMAAVGERRAAPRRPALLPAWLAAAAVLALVAGLGLFFRGRSGVGSSAPAAGNAAADAALERMRMELARDEAGAYLRQSQLLLTGLLNDCASEDMAPWEMRLASRQAKDLLLRKKYFQPGLSGLEWSKLRPVSERIDWLSYEILQLEEEGACRDITRLQRVMEDEKLLLKIRLLRNELDARGYREV